MALSFQFDPGIYQRHAEQKMASDQALMNAIAGAAQMHQDRMMQRESRLDAARQKELERNEAARLEALKPENILAKSIQFGEESLTPEERSAFNAYEQMEAAQRKSDMLGNIYQPYQPIGLGESRLATALQAAPTTDYDTMLQPPSEEDYAPTPIGEKKEKVADLLEGVPSRVAGSPKVQADVAKEVAVSRLKQMEKEKEEAKEKKEKEFSAKRGLAVLDKMIEYNRGTADMAYAGSVQPVTRLVDEDAARNMALLKQMRLRLAAPLAKQLGVNPTDKDFQNTLDQIFNENESKETREEMLKSAKQLISGDIEGSEFYNEISEAGMKPSEEVEESPGIREGTIIQNKEGKRMILRGGEWQAL